nr:hypothetical protein [Saliphagus sp. LR7]
MDVDPRQVRAGTVDIPVREVPLADEDLGERGHRGDPSELLAAVRFVELASRLDARKIVDQEGRVEDL